jgi:hypothetical protein
VELDQLRSKYAEKCTIKLNDETYAWEAIWHPTPTATCLTYAPDLAALGYQADQGRLGNHLTRGRSGRSVRAQPHHPADDSAAWELTGQVS